MRIHAAWLTCLMVLAASSCIDKPASEGSGATAEPALAASFTPDEPIPNMHPLLAWANLRLGMSSMEISQSYNAPDGQGDGFTRVLQQFGSSVTQVITFDRGEGEPLRTITCGLYRDELFLIVDRREGYSLEQANAWFAECLAKYGDGFTETVAGAQWQWGEAGDIQATFTQDNASDLYMTCTLVIEHLPTKEAWHAYNDEWDERHPQD